MSGTVIQFPLESVDPERAIEHILAVVGDRSKVSEYIEALQPDDHLWKAGLFNALAAAEIRAVYVARRQAVPDVGEASAESTIGALPDNVIPFRPRGGYS